jgi:hypothetical protein
MRIGDCGIWLEDGSARLCSSQHPQLAFRIPQSQLLVSQGNHWINFCCPARRDVAGDERHAGEH